MKIRNTGKSFSWRPLPAQSGRTRREFLTKAGRLISTIGAAGALTPFSAVNAFAQGSDYKALVCVFLFGGNDANNMIVPLDSRYATYASVRGTVAIPQSSLLPVVTASGEVHGLHPSLAPIHPLWAAKKMASVLNVGTLVKPTTKAAYQSNSVPIPSNLFSHSDQQQQWQTASPLMASATGWGGRVADKIQGLNLPSNFPPSVAISGNSLQLQGFETKPTTIQGNFGIEGNNGSGRGNARMGALQEILKLDSGVVLFQAANRILGDSIGLAKQVEEAINSGPAMAGFPGSSLGQQFAQVARIIQARAALGMRRQIFFLSQGGYDTHNGQLPDHANLLSDLAQSMLAFYNATTTMGVADQVTTFMESEFNRTFTPNGNVGTDHAWGTHVLALGGSVLGGKAIGSFPVLAVKGPDDVSDTRGNWIPAFSLDQYGATFAQWFGVNAVDLNFVFPHLANFSQKTLGFLPGT
jgi:uncharacterized protein (DUF1501 family)